MISDWRPRRGIFLFHMGLFPPSQLPKRRPNSRICRHPDDGIASVGTPMMTKWLHPGNGDCRPYCCLPEPSLSSRRGKVLHPQRVKSGETVMTSPVTIGCRRLWAVAACLLGSLSFVPALHAESIKIGAPIPITGPYSSDGGVMDRGERLAIDE